MTRDERQSQLAVAVEGAGFNGTIEAATGFGKSRVGLLTINRFRRIKPNSTVLVIVPTIDLMCQWKGLLQKNYLQGVDVMVINTAYKEERFYDYYILDEAHRYGAPEFSRIFEFIQNSPTLLLTATLQRNDGMDKMLLAKAPLVGRVSIDECIQNKWVSPYTIFNLAVPFTADELSAYTSANTNFKKCAAYIGGLPEAMSLLKIGTPEQKRMAAAFMRFMRLRKTLCQTAQNKLQVVLDCLQRFNTRRTVIFSEDIAFADSVYNAIPETTVLLHSKLKASERKIAKSTFETDKTKMVLATVKAANEGIDIPDLSLAIIAAGNSQKRDMIQRIGRTIRSVEGKHAVIINLYVPGTQAEVWLRNALKEFTNGVYWIRSLDEIPYPQ